MFLSGNKHNNQVESSLFQSNCLIIWSLIILFSIISHLILTFHTQLSVEFETLLLLGCPNAFTLIHFNVKRLSCLAPYFVLNRCSGVPHPHHAYNMTHLRITSSASFLHYCLKIITALFNLILVVCGYVLIEVSLKLKGLVYASIIHCAAEGNNQTKYQWDSHVKMIVQ